MTLDPILSAPPIIQAHVLAAICAVIIGPFALLRRSRDIWHKRFGYVWVIAMATTALTSLAISSDFGLGPISPIHILSVLTLWGLYQGINAARARRIKAHQKEMRNLYFWAIGIAGLFTFLPGRRMNLVLFGQSSLLGFYLMAAVIGAGLAWYAYRARRLGASSQ